MDLTGLRADLQQRAERMSSRAWCESIKAAGHCSTRDTGKPAEGFAAVAVLQQVERRAFRPKHVDRRVSWPRGTTISPAVTPYHLLTHTSGIGDADEEAGESYEALFVDRPNHSIATTVDFLP
jgi:Beta-lactamase